MERSSGDLRRVLKRRARLAGLPAGAPIAAAAEVAARAACAGVSPAEAVEEGWRFLQSWLAHPAGGRAIPAVVASSLSLAR